MIILCRCISDVYCAKLQKYWFSTVFCTNTVSELHYQWKHCVKVLTLVQSCKGNFLLQFQQLQRNNISVYMLRECQELECNVGYLDFVTQFHTVSITAMSHLRKFMLTCVRVQKVLVFTEHPGHLPSITTKIAAPLLNLQQYTRRTPNSKSFYYNR